MDAWLNRWQAQVAPVIAEDANGPGSEDFERELAILRANVATLRDALRRS